MNKKLKILELLLCVVKKFEAYKILNLFTCLNSIDSKSNLLQHTHALEHVH
jgi:hypothetical protein